MNPEKFKDLIFKNKTSQIHQSDLDALITEFPYFDILRLVELLQVKQNDPQKFSKMLSHSAIFFSDKKRLYQLLNTDLRNTLYKDFDTKNSNFQEDSETADPQIDTDPKELLNFSYSASQKIVATDEVEKLPQTIEENRIEQSHSDKKISLIDRFLIEDPGPIRADKKTSLTGDVSKASIMESENLLTDTLAKIYVKQGLFSKAIFAYEKLSLKYPEKSVYFASQIKEIKEIINKK